MNNIRFKVNDLLAEIWIKWIDKLFTSFDSGLMLDFKWHDIQNTDINYIRKLSKYDLSKKDTIVTMHASNWFEALQNVVETRDNLWLKIKIFAVTALTSLDDWDTNIIYDENSKYTVLKLAQEALDAWVDWVVCSPLEAQLLRDVYSDYDFEIITPWVRFKWSEKWDQKRVTTPEEAIDNWSSHIVMWRDILSSENSIKTQIQRFFDEINWVLCENADENRNKFEKLLYTWNMEDFLKHIWAFYLRSEWWKYCRLASWLISDAYINIWATERNYLVLESLANGLADNILDKWIEADCVLWAQMWSVRLSGVLAEKLWIEQSIYAEKNEYDSSSSINVWKESWIWWEYVIVWSKWMWLKKDWEYQRKLKSEEQNLILKRHDIDLSWKKVILSEDIITKWSTLEKMIKLVEDWWWEVVAVTCVWNRSWKKEFNWIPLITLYTPPSFNLYYDDKTPENQRKDYPKLPEWSQISEKPKNEWNELINS
jgi:orotidine-5'-phosphate decarboxylase